jgi:hypothetical protein
MEAPKPLPKLRLFISTDIVNSTSFKQRRTNDKLSQDGPHPWLTTFNDFFSSIREELSTLYETKKDGNSYGDTLGECPKFWKAAGDEVILVQTIEHEDQPFITISLFLEIITKIRATIRSAGPGLDLKITAWLAGFPLNNAEFVLGIDRQRPEFPGSDDHYYSHYVYLDRFYQKPEPGEMLDFIGTQMDLGFRLASLATPRKLIISLDLAWILINTFKKDGDLWPNLFELTGRIRFDGTKTLKGVLSGAPYPIFWIDVKPDHLLNSAEDGVEQITPIPLSSVTEYCQQFFEHYSDDSWLSRPFVYNREDSLENLPKDYREKLTHLQDRLGKDFKKYETEKSNLLESKSGAEPLKSRPRKSNAQIEDMLKKMRSAKLTPKK